MGAWLLYSTHSDTFNTSKVRFSSSAAWALCLSLCSWHYWGPVIPTMGRIGSQIPGRFPYSHCGWASLRPSDSDYGQNWKTETGEIPLLSLRLGVIEAEWFRLWPGAELEARDRGDSPTLIAVGRHEAQWFRLRAELEARDGGDSPTLSKWSQWVF
jgi:hypothetical protein